MRLEEDIIRAINEWRKGCTDAPPERPWECPDCTEGLIDAIEAKCIRARAEPVGELDFSRD